MHSLHPELTRAMAAMLGKLDALLRDGGYAGEPVRMFLAGGMALHFHCGTRFTEDVDATFSARLLLPLNELTVDYRREDGTPSALYFDANYNDTFALMHPDCRKDAVEWRGLGNETRLVQLFVLTPLDLAVSKISRFSPQDREDIALLASRRFFTAAELRGRALEALQYYVGNTAWVRGTIERVCAEMG
ncbi:MAG: DUF6036 family nucleotidyltransferase [Verrucomicrobiota bacterium]